MDFPDTSPTYGLSAHEAHTRLLTYGPNTSKQVKKSTRLHRLLSHFSNPLMLILIGVAAISFILGDTINASIVVLMIMLSVGLNFFQEQKASAAAEKLLEHVALTTTVLRDGKEQLIKTSLLVPGDIVLLNAGDLIAADGYIRESRNCFVNQSVLTGESFPVKKVKKPNSEVEPRPEHCVLAGTNVVTGFAKVVITKTGQNTQFGSIAQRLDAEEDSNDFTKGVNRFSSFMSKVIIVFVVLIFVLNMLIRQDFIGSLVFAIAVAVGLTPEFLPMIMAVTMSMGALRMSKNGVIVKKLTAIPTFGSMTVLCTDKTGTLTKDAIELVRYEDIFGSVSNAVLKFAYLNSIFESGITNPLDEAIRTFKKLDISGYAKQDEIPFDFERKKMSVIVSLKNTHTIITKGAPEEILQTSTHIMVHHAPQAITESLRRQYIEHYHMLSKSGFRVLAVAVKEIPNPKKHYTQVDEHSLTIIGFTAFLDPVKPNIKDIIDHLEKIGIEMKVITGDNELVTQKICTDAGIVSKGILLGTESERITDVELEKRINDITIFARFSPLEKERIIRLLKNNGAVVGYMGDGINDAPSLKCADVGISVANAVDVAKESADLILTHKSLRILSTSVLEGRKTFGNTMKYVMMGLSSNFGNMFSVLGAVIFLPFLPMLPIQILLNNFLYDVSQLSLPTDKVDEEYTMTPKKWDIQFIRSYMISFGLVSSFFDFLTFGVLYVLFHASAPVFQTGWFIESLATQVLVIYVIRTKKIPFFQSAPSHYLLATTALVVCIGWLIPYTPLGVYFSFEALPYQLVIALGTIVVLYLISAEITKHIFYRYRAK